MREATPSAESIEGITAPRGAGHDRQVWGVLWAGPAVSLADQTRDQDLLAAIADGHLDAMETLYQLWAPRLSAVLRRAGIAPAEVADVLQIIFVEIWQKASHYRVERGTVGTWLYRIARNRTIDYLRRHPPHALPAEEVGPDVPVLADSDQDLQIDLKDAMGRLNAREKALLELIYYGGFTQREVAQAWGVPVGTVKSWGHRALAKLRHTMGQKSEDQDGHATSR